MKKERPIKIQYHGSEKKGTTGDDARRAAPPPVAINDGSEDWEMSGLVRGELYINDSAEDPTIFFLKENNEIGGIKPGGNLDESDKRYLRKDTPDTAEEHITFKKGITSTDIEATNNLKTKTAEVAGKTKTEELEVARIATADIIHALNKVATNNLHFTGNIRSLNYNAGLLGSGVCINANGKIEADSLELRKSLLVPELIYNQVRVIGQEMWVTEGGVINKLILNEHNLLTVSLKLESGELNPFYEHDIIRGIWKDLDPDTRQFKGFKTYQFRVEDIFPDNTMRILMQVPGEIPPSDMTIARIGNFTHANRQRSIYLSAKKGYIRFLDGMNGWDITPDMIKMQIGKLDGLTIPGLDNLTGYNALLDNVIARGSFVQVSGDGVTEQPIPCMKGRWDYIALINGIRTCYYYDQVTHNGCTYLCVAKPSTTTEPTFDSLNWIMTEGNDKLSLSLDSSEGYIFVNGRIDTTLKATVFSGYTDISNKVPAYKWFRESGDNTSDLGWNQQHLSVGREVHITNQDIPPSLEVPSVKFTCMVTLYVGREDINLKDSIEI